MFRFGTALTGGKKHEKSREKIKNGNANIFFLVFGYSNNVTFSYFLSKAMVLYWKTTSNKSALTIVYSLELSLIIPSEIYQL